MPPSEVGEHSGRRYRTAKAITAREVAAFIMDAFTLNKLAGHRHPNLTMRCVHKNDEDVSAPRENQEWAQKWAHDTPGQLPKREHLCKCLVSEGVR
jgi:hypothetical protein